MEVGSGTAVSPCQSVSDSGNEEDEEIELKPPCDCRGYVTSRQPKSPFGTQNDEWRRRAARSAVLTAAIQGLTETPFCQPDTLTDTQSGDGHTGIECETRPHSRTKLQTTCVNRLAAWLHMRCNPRSTIGRNRHRMTAIRRHAAVSRVLQFGSSPMPGPISRRTFAKPFSL